MNVSDVAEKMYDNKQYHQVIEMSYQHSDLDVLFYAAKSLQNIGKIDEALELWETILKRDALHEKTIRALAWFTGDTKKRLSHLEKLARLNLADSEDLSYMASIYLEQHGRYQDAHHWFQKSLELNKNNSLSLLGLADLHARLSIYYLQETEDLKDLDLNNQLSDNSNSEEVLKFMYEYITVKELVNGIP